MSFDGQSFSFVVSVHFIIMIIQCIANMLTSLHVGLRYYREFPIINDKYMTIIFRIYGLHTVVNKTLYECASL